jgi:FkbM family methyltransferase
MRYGSEYGGWVLAEDPYLRDSLILSCGLGEDASFDLEIAAKLGVRVVFIDPTPRATEHYRQIIQCLGKARTSPYSINGIQDIDSYELSGVSEDQLLLLEYAISNVNETLRFFAPRDPRHVSYSLKEGNWQHTNRDDFLYVPARTASSILSECKLPIPSLIKLDIEGSELDVVENLLDTGILPKQLLIEFDILREPKRSNRQRFRATMLRLESFGYSAIYFDKRTCITFVRDSRFA